MDRLPDTVDFSVVLVGLVVFLFSLLLIKRVTRDQRTASLNLPPQGPAEWPVVGSIPSLTGDETCKLLAEMSQRHGPIFYTRIGSVRTVVLGDYGSVKEAFGRSRDDLADRPRTGLMEILTQGRGIISAHVGESQRKRRRFGLSALRSLGMGKSRLVENVVAEIQTLKDVISSKDGAPFSPRYDVTISVSNVIAWIVLGKRFRHDDDVYRRFLDIIHETLEICDSTNLSSFVPLLRYLPLPIWRRAMANESEWDAINIKMIENAKGRPHKEGLCFVQMYLKELEMKDQTKDAKGSPENGKCTMEPEVPPIGAMCEFDLRQTVADLFAAATDTTATTLQWAILFLILHPDIQRRVHTELKNVLGTDRLPTLEDRESLPYIEAVLLEVQRASSVLPLGVPHAAAWDTKLLDYDIPAGTLVLPNLWGVHHDPLVWKDPDEFFPERFLNTDQSAVVKPEEFIPFCIGRRKCLGEQLAQMELFLFFTHLCYNFEFRLPEGATPPPSTKGKIGITRSPLPYQVCAVRRSN